MNAVAGSRRAATTLMDQAFSSASNFAVGVAVARVAGAAGLGAFAFAYVGWVVLSDMHRSLITDPMNIEGDARRNGNPSIERGFVGRGAAWLRRRRGVCASRRDPAPVPRPYVRHRDTVSGSMDARGSSCRTTGATWPL